MRVPTQITPRTQREQQGAGFIRNAGSAGPASSAQLGNQLVSAGNTLGSVGGLLQQQASQARKFGVMQNFSAFQSSVDERMVELKRGVDPSQGNFADQAVANYSNWEDEWLATVPDEFYDEFKTRAADTKASVARDSLAFQYESTDAFFKRGMQDGLNLSLTSLDQDGSAANLGAQRAQLDEMLANTSLTPSEQLTIQRQYYSAIESVSYKSEVRRGNLDRGALGVGSAPGEAADLLLEFDGASLDNGLDYETNRDLIQARVGEAEQTAVAAVGSIDRWAALPSRARAVLISLVDDLGELPESVKQAIDSGDLEAVAGAVAELSGTEGDRRATEAGIIMGTGQMPEGQLDADPAYANIAYEDRLALRADADREAASEQVAQQAQAKAAQEAATNELMVNLFDGKAGQYQIDQAREAGWLTDYTQIKKAQDIILKQTEGLAAVQKMQGMLASGQTLSPGSEDDKKMFNAYIGEGGLAAMRSGDQDYVRNVLVPAVRGAGDLPTDSVNLLTGMMRAQDPAQALFALDTLAQLEQASPEAYNARVTEAIAADVEYWRTIKDYYPQDEVLASVRGGVTQEERTRTTMLREEAKKLVNDGSISTDTATERFISGLVGTLGDARGWQNGDPVMTAGMKSSMNADFAQLFEREYARDGNEAAAQTRATTALSRIWSTTNAGGQQLLMKYPPELVGYEKWNDSHDWITQQGRSELGLEDGETFQLISDEQTHAEFQNGQGGGSSRPSYLAVYKDVNGNLKMPMDEAGRPQRIFFEITPEMEAEKAADFNKKQAQLGYEDAVNTFQQAQRHSLHTGTPIPPEVQDNYEAAVEEFGEPRSTQTVFGNWGTK